MTGTELFKKLSTAKLIIFRIKNALPPASALLYKVFPVSIYKNQFNSFIFIKNIGFITIMRLRFNMSRAKYKLLAKLVWLLFLRNINLLTFIGTRVNFHNWKTIWHQPTLADIHCKQNLFNWKPSHKLISNKFMKFVSVRLLIAYLPSVFFYSSATFVMFRERRIRFYFIFYIILFFLVHKLRTVKYI